MTTRGCEAADRASCATQDTPLPPSHLLARKRAARTFQGQENALQRRSPMLSGSRASSEVRLRAKAHLASPFAPTQPAPRPLLRQVSPPYVNVPIRLKCTPASSARKNLGVGAADPVQSSAMPPRSVLRVVTLQAQDNCLTAGIPAARLEPLDSCELSGRSRYADSDGAAPQAALAQQVPPGRRTFEYCLKGMGPRGT